MIVINHKYTTIKRKANAKQTHSDPNNTKNKEIKEYIYSKFYDEQILIAEQNNNNLYKQFVNFLFNNILTKKPMNKVLSMSDQITFENFDKWHRAYGHEKLKKTIIDLENSTKKTYKSFTLTLNNWLKNDFGK